MNEVFSLWHSTLVRDILLFHLEKSNFLRLYTGSDKDIQGIRYDRVAEELWMEVQDIVQEAGIKAIPKKKKCKKAK